MTLLPGLAWAQPANIALFPATGAVQVNPDTHLTLTFDRPPAPGTSGLIRIYDMADHSLVDTLDMSVPPSPNPTGRAPRPAKAGVAQAPRPGDVSVLAAAYQVTTIGGFDFHFFPVIVHDRTAIIYPHHGALKYGHKYGVRIDPGVLTMAEGAFAGLAGDTDWTFTTKAAPPPASATHLVVSVDGNGDFSTVQGAVDFVPAAPAKPVTVFIKSGDYEELVFMNGKSGLILRGEDRQKVVVHYPNNSAFNPPAGGPSRRPAFSIYNSTDIQLSTFTIRNDFIGQAEALLITGSRNIVDRMTLNGSGDALTMHGSVYLVDSLLTGDGDTCLCYGPAYFLRTEIRSVGPFSWTRNPAGTHGNIFVDSTFIASDKPLPWTVNADSSGGQQVKKVFARLPRNGATGSATANFPYAEMVLTDARVQGVPPEGWGPIEEAPGFDSANVHFWEYNTRDLAGQPVDVSQRHPVSKQLTLPKDAETIANYRRPDFVLGGWTPVVR